MSSHGGAITDFSTALSLLGSEKIENGFGGSRFGEAYSGSEPQDTGDLAATAVLKGVDDGSGDDPRTPHQPFVPNVYIAYDGEDQNMGQEDVDGEDDRHTLEGGEAFLRRSQSADGGDGMAEGGSVVCACHYAR